jgi:amino acid adenylation domain-containing protein
MISDQTKQEKETISTSNKHSPTTQSFQPSWYQERLFFLEALNSAAPSHNIVVVMHIKGRLDQDLFKESLARVIERHAILRTRLVRQEGHTFQQVNTTPPDKIIDAHKLSHLTPDKLNSTFEGWVQTAHTHRFELDSYPLFHAKLSEFSPSDHRLLFYASRLIFDEWSFRQLIREASIIYQSLATGQSPELEPLSIQFPEDAGKMRQNPDSTVQSYWLQHLKNAPQILEIPTDYPRNALQENYAGRQGFSLPEELTESLETFADQINVRPRTLVAAAFGVLINRYTGRDDFLIGSRLFPRSQPEMEALIGPLGNDIILRMQLQEEDSFFAFINRFKKILQEAEIHHAQPFEELINILEPERDLSRQPLVQVMFEYFDTSPEQVDCLAVEWQIEDVRIEPNIVDFDMSLQIWKTGEQLEGHITFNKQLYSDGTIQRLLNNFEVLLAAITANPDKHIARLTILANEERTLLLDTWNQTEREFPHYSRYHDIFESQAAKNPDRIAASCENLHLTYDELNRAANRLGRFLLTKGLQLDAVVAIYAERDIDFLAAILAIFKTGGVYLPLDLRHPPTRIQQVLEQSKTKIVLVSDAYADNLSQAFEEIPDKERPAIFSLVDALQQEMDDSNLGITYPPKKMAYIIFTSGSTGKPKGAIVEHRGMLNHLYAKIFDLDLTAEDTVAQNAPQSFDISVWQFLVCLLKGACVRIYGDQIAHAPEKLLRCVADDEVTILEVVPSIMRLMVDAVSDDQGRLFKLPKLRWLMPTGEALPPSLAREWLGQFPHIPLINAYGPTECSDDVTHYPIHTPPDPQVINMPIGRPITNMKIYLLDAYLSPVPIGVVGEIYIGGIGVGKGYINDPERTALAFMSDPFSEVPNGRMYKTGDLGRYLSDGIIEFLGRVDFQVKVSGQRIELKEIEAVLERCPAVDEVVVATHALDTGRQCLVAYVVPAFGTVLSDDDLLRVSQESLPEYMIPSSFVMLDTFPQTSSGKIDRNALPTPVFSQEECQYLPPTNDVEKALEAMWCKLLGAKKVSIRDNYFRLGGDSMGAVILFSHIHKQFGVDLHLSTIYKTSTIQQLAELIEQSKKEGVTAVPSLVPIKTTGTKPPLFFVHAHGGHVLFFNNLSQYLGDDQPFYAFQAQGLDGREPPLDNFKDMAVRYVRELVEFKPKGPYYLGSDCLGGYIAFEMAHLLKEAGHEVAFLAMVDNYSPSYEKYLTTPEYIYKPLFYLQRLYGVHLKSLLASSSEQRRNYINRLINHCCLTMNNIKYRIRRKFDPSTKPDTLNLVIENMSDAEREYTVAKIYDGKITLFRASKLPLLTKHANDFGWNLFTTQAVEVHHIRGYLYNIILEPSVQSLANKMKECLKAAYLQRPES